MTTEPEANAVLKHEPSGFENWISVYWRGWPSSMICGSAGGVAACSWIVRSYRGCLRRDKSRLCCQALCSPAIKFRCVIQRNTARQRRARSRDRQVKVCRGYDRFGLERFVPRGPLDFRPAPRCRASSQIPRRTAPPRGGWAAGMTAVALRAQSNIDWVARRRIGWNSRIVDHLLDLQSCSLRDFN